MTYYDRNGQRIDMMTWAKSIEDHKAKVVAQETISGWFISTVWVGIDHSFGSGPPLIFETMIFPPDAESGERYPDLDHWQERYPTEDAARAGHDQAVAMIREHNFGGAS